VINSLTLAYNGIIIKERQQQKNLNQKGDRQNEQCTVNEKGY
jgi:hypothetical protein